MVDKPDLNKLKILSIISSSTFQKIYPLLFLYSHIIIYYFHIIFYASLFQVRHLEKHRLDTNFAIARDAMYIHINQNGQWKSASLSLKLHHLLYHCFSLILIFNDYRLFSNHACEHSIILKLCFKVPYNSQNYICLEN